MAPSSPTFRNFARALLTAPVRRVRHIDRLERLEDRCNPAPVATITGLPAVTQPLIGETVNYALTFTNTGPDTGFAPFIELGVDTTGADGTAGGLPQDGIGTPVVTAAGLALSPRGSVTLVAGQTTFTNPITGEAGRPVPTGLGAGDIITFYALPFGSFTPAQSTAVNISLPTSNRADLNTPLPVSVTGGFRDDAPSLAGPAFYGARADGAISPQLYTLRKIYQGPESETATGPNYVRRYRLEVDIATGQTVTDLRINDVLADSMQLVARDATVIAGSPNIGVFLGGAAVAFVPARLTATGGAATGATVPTAPGGSITYNFVPTGSYTSIAGVDAALEFNFYVPRDRNPAGAPDAPDPAAPTVAQGTDSTTGVNTTSSTLDWTPFDTRDAVQNDIGPSAALSTLSHTLEQQSVAIQKGATLVDRATGAAIGAGQPIRPGQTLVRYTLNFQVSDYFALNDVFVRDVVGDGQRLYLGAIGGGVSSAPTLTVNNAFLTGAPGTRQTTSGAFTDTDVIEYQRRFNLGAQSDPTSFDPAAGPAGAIFNVLATSIQPDGPGSDAGTTFLQFNVSQELRARLGATAGRLVGAEILNDGTGPENDNHPQTNPPPGAVTGTIVFYAEVTEEFSDSFRTANGGSNDPSVDQGDVLGNTVNDPRTPLRDGIFGDQISAATINSLTPTVIGRGSDDSGTSLSIPYGVQSKVIAAINGQGVPAQGFTNPPFTVQAGDRVTYLLTYTLPISRFEQLRLQDFPPLPVLNLSAAPNNAPTFTRNPALYGFNAGEVGVFVSGTTPGGVNDAAFVSDTYFNTFAPANGAGRNPALSIDGPNNGLTLNFGTQDDLQDRSTVISVLVTFTVGNDPFAADLFLTNQLRVLEGSTNAGTTTVEAIQRFELVRPLVSLYKGIVGTQQGAAAATGSTFGDVVFTGPGTAFGFSNQLNTVAEAVALGNANTAALDAGDQVRFALVAQNTGQGDAFDTRIRDVLPTGYVIPAAFPGRVFRGAGGAELTLGVDYTLVSYNAATGEFVIELVDNYTAGNVGGAAEDARGGGISRGVRTDQTLGDQAITNGSNAVVVIFDLTLAGSVAPGQALTNTATIPQYSNTDGGPNYTNPAVVPGATIPTDTATVTVPVAGTKTITSTTEVSTVETGTGTNANPRLMTVGEVIRYRLAFQLAEGTATNFQIRDNLPTGLTFLDDGTASVAFVSNGVGITSSSLAGAGLNVTGASGAVAPTFLLPAGAITGGPFVTGTDPVFSLGTLVNSDSDTDGEFVVIEFNALLDNSVAGSNDAGDLRDNSFAALVNGTSVFTSGTVRVRVVEPSITDVVKGATPTSGDAGDTVTFTVAFSNANTANGATAFDLNLTDILPAVGYENVQFVAGSLVTTGATNAAVAVAGNTVTFTADALAVGGTVAFQYTARLVAGVGPGFYRNTANLTYTSLPGTNGAAAPGAPGSDTGERTGSGVGPNDLLDSDFEDVLVNVPLVKTIVGTNQLFTIGNVVAVGEQVQYQVVVSIPEGTTPTAVLRDALPAGMAVVSLDSITATADVGLTTDVAGGFPAVLTAARAALASPGQNFSFNLGTLVNADRDAGAETLTFTYTVVVLNTAGNQRGTTLTNSATFANGGVDRTTGSAPAVTVAEPTLRVTKTASPTTGDASNNDADAVTFTIVIDHAPGSNTDAFNVSLADLIPAGFTLVAGSFTNTAGVAPATLAEGGTLTATYTSLALGQSSTLTFRARLNGTTTPGQTVTNTASITYTSLPGDVTAPQSNFNTNSVERTGAGGINDYTASDPADVTVNSNQLGGNIYRDLDNDGVFEPGAGETLILTSTRVQLTGVDNLGFAVNLLLTTTTGTYNFTGLRPGSYTVTQLDQPAGLLDGRDTPGTSSPGAAFGGTGTAANAVRNPRDADAITSINIGLGGSKTGINYDFGEILPAVLGDFVWLDVNGNGRQDGGTEVGLNGVPVTLTGVDDGGTPVSLSTTTAGGGLYQFTNLRPSGAGGYVVTFGTLAGFVRTVRDSAVATDATDSDGDPTTGATAGVTLLAGGSNQTIDQGLYQPVSLGDRVYFDRDADGVQDAGEPGIPGAVIQVVWLGPDGALGGGDDLTFNTTTGVNGAWAVGNLPPGSYQVTATPPAGQGWALTDSLDNGALSATNPVTVSTTSGVNLTTVDYGFRSTGSIGNRLYIDADGDGVQDANGLEPGLPGVTVTLRYDANADGDFTDADDGLFTTVTDAAGAYTFGFLPPGAYQVSVAGAAGLPANVVLTDSLDNGALSATATVTKALALGENEVTYDFGFQGNASLGDRVYYDADGDGVQDASEPGIAGATVTAIWVGPDGAFGGGDDVTFTTTTDALGNYLFPGIPANAGAGANYRVTVAAPAAFPIFTDSLDNGALAAVRPVDVQVSPTDGTPLNDRRDVDFGFRGTAALGDVVFLDSNGNGRQDGGTEAGIPGVSVTLLFDRNNDGDFADAGEDTALATTTTGAGGAYAFTDLAAGNYQVVFGTTAGSVTYARTVRDSAVADDTTDSDADPATGRTATYTLANGDNNTTVDAGLYVPVSLGDRVYFDADADGVQDAGEPGIPGAAITVVWLGPDGALGGGDDLTFNTTTGVNGAWAVGNLPPGNYQVTATPPAGQGWALTDSLDNGAVSATNPVTVSTTSGVDRTDIDYGFRSTGSLGNRLYIDADGDGVQDANGLEPGLPGVTVTLRYDANADGDFADADDGLFTTVTDAAGAYSFPFLPPGAYQVSVAGAAGLPANVVLTDSLDNGALSATATVTKALALGENEVTYDFGFQGNASLGDRVYYDADGDGAQDANEPGVAGATVTAVWVGSDGAFGGGDDVTFTTTTDALGNYLFPGLPANALVGATPNYRVTVSAPAAFPIFTDSLDDATLSATRPVDVQVSPTDGTPLNDRRDVDFGFRGTAALGDTVFLDSNGNGRQDGGTEVGIPGVSVTLFFDRNADGDFADAGENVALATTTTGGGGAYAFTDLAAGNYQVVFGTTAAGVTYTRTVRDSAVADDTTDSDADPATGRTATYTLANGDNNTTVDTGLYVPVSLGDRVYFDFNGDGVQDAGEPGIPGAAVEVVWLGPDGALGGGDDVTFTTVTGVNGAWAVANLPPGSYQVTATPPAGQGWALTDSLDDAALSATNPVTVSTTSGVDRADVDFGFRSTGSIGNRLYIDANGDGVQDANGLEPGLPGVTVTLRYDANADGDFTDADDGLFATVTDAAGAYTFPFLPPGAYQVSVAGAAGLPANVVLTDSLDDGALGATDTVTKTLALGENEVTYDFGYQGNASLGDRVYYDADGDGNQDANEPGIAGATVTAVWVGPDGVFGGVDVTFTTTTDALGNYLFPGIPANALAGDNYRVDVSAPAAFPVFTDSLDDATLSAVRPVDVSVSPAEGDALNDRRDVDFGFRGTAALGDTVFLDSNGNGRQDGGAEVGIPGVGVTLFYDRNADGDFADVGEDVPLATTTTGAGGAYAFTDLAAGNYQVVFGTTAGSVTYARTVRDSAVADDTTDSDADPATGRTATYTLANGDNNTTVDAGLYVPVSLGDRVYYDLNADGVQQPGELGVPGVGIQVVWHGPDGAPGGGDDLSFNTVTGANGIWAVPNLPPGSYTVTATPVEGVDQLTDSLDDATLSATNPVVVSTTSGVDRTDVDFGFRGLGTVGDRVFLDVNANGTYDAGEGLDGVTVTLTGDLNGDGTPDTLTTTTAADGFYQFSFVRVTDAGVPYTVTIDTATLPSPVTNTVDPDTAGTGDNTSSLTLTAGAPSNQLQDFGYRGPGRIGDVVFLDANNNGAPDAGEGITGVVVRLRGDVDGDGTVEEFFATTTALGVYDFSNLPVLDRNGEPITYTVTVDPNGTTLPAGVTNTTDPDGGNDGSSVLTLDDVPVNLAQDFGYRGPGSIGDRVFLDVNANGSFDPGEGLTAVTVTLTADLNGDGLAETLGATTDADGFYQFTGLPVFQNDGTTPVAYVVTVVTGTLPAGLTNTVDPDTAGTGDNTASLTLDAGNPTNQLQDFGYRGTGVLGDRVWIDSNNNGVQDAVALEPGLPGVGLTLTWAGADDAFGTPDDVTGTTTTDAAGNYTFNGLPLDLGRFRVDVTPATLPGNSTQTFDLDGLGSANSAGTGTAITLTTGTPTRDDVDFGYVGASSLGDRVFVDQNRDGVQQATEGGIPGATVTLTWGGPDGDLATAADNVTFTITTGADGLYLFPGLMVNGLADDYRVQVTVPAAGFTLTDSLDNADVQAQNPVDVSVGAAEARRDVDFGFAGNGSLAGVVFRDDSNDGTQQVGEPGLGGVVVTLTGTDVFGNPVLDPATGQPYTTTTQPDGSYSFVGLPPGTYTLTETQPTAYGDGIDTAGTLNGTAGNDVISGIVVGPNEAGTGYTFGELPTFVSGTVFRDDDRDGTQDAGEPGIPGVRVELRDPVSGALITFATTDANGNYTIDRIPAGDYTLVEIQPTGYADSPVGPATVRNITVPTTGLTGQNYAEVLGSLSGRVYVDTNANGTRDAGEPGLPGVTVTITGTDVNGNPVSRDAVTGTDGTYTFLNLFPANEAGYTITEAATPLYADRAANVGTGFDTPGTAATPNTVVGVNLTPGQTGVDYDFGEVTGSLSGFVYADFDMSGTRTLTGAQAETGVHIPGTNTPGGIGGITVTLTGTDNAGTPVSITTTTAADGSYTFAGLLAGTYTLTETQPPAPTGVGSGFYDGAESQGSAGGTVVAPSPTFTSDPNKNRIVLISLPAGVNGTDYNFGELPPADPFGFVYVDANRNGVRDAGERGIAGVPITLSGTAFAGTAFARPLAAADVPGGLTQLTDADGRYEFVPIPAGLYTVTQDRQPAGFADGLESDGDPNGPPATIGNEVISNIQLAPFPIRGPFNFGEILLAVPPGTLPPIDFFPAAPEDPSKRLFLTTTPEALTPPAAGTAPNFAAFNPGARPTTLAAVAEGPGGTGLVRVFDFAGGNERFRFRPFGDFAGGARVTTADVTADGIPDVIVVPGVDGGPVVKVFDGNSGAEVRSFFAFEESFRGGLRVAAADLNGDFVADIIVTPDTGGGPIVRAFDGRTGAVIANFFALDPTFRGGLRVATGDINRDGTPDVVVTAGEGGGPRVAVYDGRTLGQAEPARLANDFFAFAPELRSGFWVSSADVDSDGFADIVMGAGAGGAPRVVVYSGRLLSTTGEPREVASFFAGDPAERGGARVLAADLDGDGRAEVLSASGAGTWPRAFIFDPLTGLRRDVFYATSAPFRGGVEVG